MLISYDWPGNVRELENVIERALALSPGPVLELEDLPSHVVSQISQIDEHQTQSSASLTLEELRRKAILRALREADGDKCTAARMLGIGKTTLYRKLKHYELASVHM